MRVALLRSLTIAFKLSKDLVKILQRSTFGVLFRKEIDICISIFIIQEGWDLFLMKGPVID